MMLTAVRIDPGLIIRRLATPMIGGRLAQQPRAGVRYIISRSQDEHLLATVGALHPNLGNLLPVPQYLGVAELGHERERVGHSRWPSGSKRHRVIPLAFFPQEQSRIGIEDHLPVIQ